MACYYPTKAYRTPPGSDKAMTFNAAKALNSDRFTKLPCGKCIGCRNDRCESWAVRCYHESQMHQTSSFITLTYDPKNYPADYSVSVPVAQTFMKVLRQSIWRSNRSKIRFFLAAEYGTKSFHPHYHALIFGYDFSNDRKLLKQTKSGPLYVSEQLTSAWGKGHCSIGTVTMKSALYCASYVFDVRGGDMAADRYIKTHPVTGDIVRCQPEFQLMSSQPGLGSTWFDKYQNDCFPSDFLVIDGKQYGVPRYYFDKLVKQDTAITRKLPAFDVKLNSTQHEEIRRARKRNSLHHKDNQTPDRLKVREIIHQSRLDRRAKS